MLFDIEKQLTNPLLYEEVYLTKKDSNKNVTTHVFTEFSWISCLLLIIGLIIIIITLINTNEPKNK